MTDRTAGNTGSGAEETPGDASGKANTPNSTTRTTPQQPTSRPTASPGQPAAAAGSQGASAPQSAFKPLFGRAKPAPKPPPGGSNSAPAPQPPVDGAKPATTPQPPVGGDKPATGKPPVGGAKPAPTPKPPVVGDKPATGKPPADEAKPASGKPPAGGAKPPPAAKLAPPPTTPPAGARPAPARSSDQLAGGAPAAAAAAKPSLAARAKSTSDRARTTIKRAADEHGANARAVSQGVTTAGAASEPAGPRSPRRARLRLTRVDPWSVMKTSFLLSIAFAIVLVVSVFMVWSVLSAAGVWDSINTTVQSVLGGDSASTFDVEDYVGTSRVLGFTLLVAALDVVLLTAVATLGAFVYNMAAALLGGIELTFTEDTH